MEEQNSDKGMFMVEDQRKTRDTCKVKLLQCTTVVGNQLNALSVNQTVSTMFSSLYWHVASQLLLLSKCMLGCTFDFSETQLYAQ
jgi:hypothetical protein